MKSFSIPYGKGVQTVEIAESNLLAVMESRVNQFDPRKSEIELIEAALVNPIESPKLSEIVQNKKNIVIITSDHTRPVPSHLTMPILLSQIRAGNPDIKITILVATGCHRPMSHQERIDRFGQKIVNEEEIAMHTATDDASMVHIGTLPSGGALWLNRLVVEAECVIAEGFIEPHFFAGFSGGRKAVLPGVASLNTVMANHCSKFIADPNSRAGILANNPIHKDMLYAAEQVNLAFILNVIINDKKQVIAAYAGHRERAHEAGCTFLNELAQVEGRVSDIVITSNGGYPLDQNIYQAVKGMTSGEVLCREGGTIIMVAACNDGHGGESFYQALAEADHPDSVLKEVMATPQEQTKADQWEYQILARILSKHRVILVTDQCDPAMIQTMHLDHAKTVQDALHRIMPDYPEAKITIIPDGVAVIVKAKECHT